MTIGVANSCGKNIWNRKITLYLHSVCLLTLLSTQSSNIFWFSLFVNTAFNRVIKSLFALNINTCGGGVKQETPKSKLNYKLQFDTMRITFILLLCETFIIKRGYKHVTVILVGFSRSERIGHIMGLDQVKSSFTRLS